MELAGGVVGDIVVGCDVKKADGGDGVVEYQRMEGEEGEKSPCCCAIASPFLSAGTLLNAVGILNCY